MQTLVNTIFSELSLLEYFNLNKVVVISNMRKSNQDGTSYEVTYEVLVYTVSGKDNDTNLYSFIIAEDWDNNSFTEDTVIRRKSIMDLTISLGEFIKVNLAFILGNLGVNIPITHKVEQIENLINFKRR